MADSAWTTFSFAQRLVCMYTAYNNPSYAAPPTAYMLHGVGNNHLSLMNYQTKKGMNIYHNNPKFRAIHLKGDAREGSNRENLSFQIIVWLYETGETRKDKTTLKEFYHIILLMSSFWPSRG